MRHITALVLIFLFGNVAPCLAYTIIATEQSNGLYADGKLETGKGEFVLRYEIDEEEGTITRTEVVNLRTKEILRDNTVYYITVNTPDPAGEKRITAVGKPGTDATEIIHLGKDSFLNCKIIFGYASISQGRYVIQQ